MDQYKCIICLQISKPFLICNTNIHCYCSNIICHECYDDSICANTVSSNMIIQQMKLDDEPLYTLICSNKCIVKRIIYINSFGEFYMTRESYGHLIIEKQEYILTKIHKRFKKCALTVLVDVMLKDLANIVVNYVYKN